MIPLRNALARFAAAASILGSLPAQPTPPTRSAPQELPESVAEFETALQGAVRKRLGRQRGEFRRIAAVRELTSRERSAISSTIPAGCPIGVDMLAAVDVRFRNPNGDERFGCVILCELFDEPAIRRQRGVRKSYGSAVQRSPRPRRNLAHEIAEFFRHNWRSKEPLPLDHVIPVHAFAPAAAKLGVDLDELSMRCNNSYAFAARKIRDTGRWSWHTIGAIDLNPFYNPVVLKTEKGKKVGVSLERASEAEVKSGLVMVLPAGAVRYAFGRSKLGLRSCFHGPDHPTVKFFAAMGWSWGGRWNSLKDYHHFSPAIE